MRKNFRDKKRVNMRYLSTDVINFTFHKMYAEHRKFTNSHSLLFYEQLNVK